jgi:hypothetical protein
MARDAEQIDQAVLIISGEFVWSTTRTAIELLGDSAHTCSRPGRERRYANRCRRTVDQPLLWSQSDDRQLKSRGRQLLEQIATGELDEHLVAIADAVHARRELLHTVRAASAIAQLCVGDTVMFSSPSGRAISSTNWR